MRMSRTFGASSGAFGPGMIVQSGTDWSIVRPDRAAEVPVGDREHRAVGDELAHRLRETVLERLQALLVRLHDRLRERARKRLLDGEPLLIVEDRDDPRRPRWQVLPDLVVHLRLDALVDELADETAGRGACGRGREQRRRGEADEDAHRRRPTRRPCGRDGRPSAATSTVPSSACVMRIAASIFTFLSLTSSASASKSFVARRCLGSHRRRRRSVCQP